MNLENKYLKYSFYAVSSTIIIFVFFQIIFNFKIVVDNVCFIFGQIIGLLKPLFIGIVIAYLLYPLVKRIERLLLKCRSIVCSKNRQDDHITGLNLTSVFLTYLLVIFILLFIIYSLYIMINGSLSNLNIEYVINTIYGYIINYKIIFTQLQIKLQEIPLSSQIKSQLLSLTTNSDYLIRTFINILFDNMKAFWNNIINILLGIIISFYLIKDIDYFKRSINMLMNCLFRRKYQQKIKPFLLEVNELISKYIQGQILDCIIVGVISTLALSLIGLDFAVLVGIGVAIANVIPYFGPFIGAIPAVIIGLLSDKPMNALFAFLILMLIQQIDGNIIAPKIIGDSVGLHPVFIMISIIIGAEYFGLLGMILAVPIAGILKLIIIKWIKYNNNKVVE